MIFLTIDSSVFLSSLLERDHYHQTSLAFFSHIHQHPYITTLPMIVVLEIANILSKYNKDPRPAIESLMALTILPHDQSTIEEAITIFKRLHLKTSDALVVWCAYVSESTLISWDKQLIRQAQKLIEASTPSDFLKKMI
ncbi:MAG: PIN domain-containing protein [Patescibacteria group bacterium]